MKQLTDEERVLRGQRARAVRQDKTIQEALEEIHSVLHLQLDNMPTNDANAMVSLVSQLRAIKALNTKLESWDTEGARIERVESGNG